MASEAEFPSPPPGYSPAMKHPTAIALGVSLLPSAPLGQAVEPVLARVKQERAPFIDTLRELVSIESGSRDIDGLNRISDVMPIVCARSAVTCSSSRLPMVRGLKTRRHRLAGWCSRGSGALALGISSSSHTWTRCTTREWARSSRFASTATAPMGWGFAYDKSGVAVIRHTVTVLNALNIRNYGTRKSVCFREVREERSVFLLVKNIERINRRAI